MAAHSTSTWFHRVLTPAVKVRDIHHPSSPAGQQAHVKTNYSTGHWPPLPSPPRAPPLSTTVTTTSASASRINHREWVVGGGSNPPGWLGGRESRSCFARARRRDDATTRSVDQSSRGGESPSEIDTSRVVSRSAERSRAPPHAPSRGSAAAEWQHPSPAHQCSTTLFESESVQSRRTASGSLFSRSRV